MSSYIATCPNQSPRPRREQVLARLFLKAPKCIRKRRATIKPEKNIRISKTQVYRILSPTAHGSITGAQPPQVPRLPPLEHPLERGPAQQAQRAKDEAPDDDLVLVAVALEAQGDDVVLLCVFAEADALAEAKGLCAVCARCRRRSAGMMMVVVVVVVC